MPLNHPVDCPEQTSRSPASSAVVDALREVSSAVQAVPWRERQMVSSAVEGATLSLLDDTEATGLLGLVRSADNVLRNHPGYRCELARWTADWPDRRDGVLPDSFGPPSRDAAMPMRDFGAYQPLAHREPEQFETHPTIAVLSTTGDTHEDWLRAGVALQRVLLEATIAGVSASFFTQPLEVAHLRRLYDEAQPQTSSQMISRLGYARQPGASPSPRRPLADMLIDD